MDQLELYRLKIFCDIVTKLNNNPFVKRLMVPDKLSVGPSLEDRWPNFWNHRQSTIDAFILNFRFLVMPRDKLDLDQIYFLLDNNGMLRQRSISQKQTFDQVTSQQFPIGFGNDSYTYEKLFKLMFYGGLAHHNEEKIKTFLMYKTNILAAALTYTCFQQYIRFGMFLGKSLKSDIMKSGMV